MIAHRGHPVGSTPHSVLAGLAALALAVPAAGQELTALAGASTLSSPREQTRGGAVEYSHDLSEHLVAAYAYRNEGHLPSHHRDGHSLQVWASTGRADGFSLRAGLGAYRYFDTAVAEEPKGFGNSHGWGTLASVAARWRTPGSRWAWELRVDRIMAHESFDTTQIVAGAGYRLDQDGSFRANATPIAHRAEVDGLGGIIIVNSFESENAHAASLDARYAFTAFLRGSIGWVNEGDARLIRRNGVIAELWLEPGFERDRFTLGVGIGPYIAIDDMYHSGPRVQGVISTTFSWRFGERWAARVIWHRISSNYDRDSDIVLAGIGYRF
jgi:hypothetical protein